MYTLGYAFRPWEHDKSIADGSTILSYVRQTAREHGIDQKIRFGHRVVAGRVVERRAALDRRGEPRATPASPFVISCDFLFICSGYYRYDEGYTPEFAGVERFGGEVVHPQFWTDDDRLRGKRVVVIGSGATAVTLVPGARRAGRARDDAPALAELRRLAPGRGPDSPSASARLLPARWAYSLIRWKNVLLTMLSFQLSRKRPELMKRLLRKGLERQLPPGYDIDTHFTPRYNPWDQRLCLVPDGDLFNAI